MGEADGFVVYSEPDVKILEKLRRNKTRTELWNDLPTELNVSGGLQECSEEDVSRADAHSAVITPRRY